MGRSLRQERVSPERKAEAEVIGSEDAEEERLVKVGAVGVSAALGEDRHLAAPAVEVSETSRSLRLTPPARRRQRQRPLRPSAPPRRSLAARWPGRGPRAGAGTEGGG
eukprot:651731-Hanusia_phi.AAC.2